jgi:hypothetical protein
MIARLAAMARPALRIVASLAIANAVPRHRLSNIEQIDRVLDGVVCDRDGM